MSNKKSNPRKLKTFRYDPKTLEELRKLSEKTGVPMNTIVEEGTLMAINAYKTINKEVS